MERERRSRTNKRTDTTLQAAVRSKKSKVKIYHKITNSPYFWSDFLVIDRRICKESNYLFTFSWKILWEAR
jgi:hypothetical protein